MTIDFPSWVTVLATASLILAGSCAAFVLVDVIRRPQPMWVMNVVWPLTMLFGSVLWMTFYLRRGRARDDRTVPEHSMRSAVAVGTSHCGAGCTLGDLVGEFTLALAPALGVAFGLGALFHDPLYAAWVLDFLLAYVFGIAFQYFSIKPMRDVSRRAGLWLAVKADTLSIAAWQIGMYGLMAIGQFVVLPALFGRRADPLTPEFWWLMQFAMIAGFMTAYPVNWWLIRRGVKERM